MSQKSTVQYEPTLVDAEWVDLEIPFGLYVNNWSQEHSNRLQRLVENGNLLKRHFTPHWDLCPSVSGSMPKKDLAIDSFRKSNTQWGAALLSGYEFARNTNKEQVLEILNDETAGISTPFDSVINEVQGSDDKKGAILLLDLIAHNRLKDIYVLSRLRRRSPIQCFDVSGTTTPLQTMDIGRFLQEFNSASRDFRKWHDFSFDGSDYITVKVHNEDEVRIQTQDNAQVEEADMVVLKTNGSEIEVYSQESDFLGAVQQGIARGIEAGDPSITNCQVDAVDATIRNRIYDNAIDVIKNRQFGQQLTLHKLVVDDAPVSGSPKIDLSKGTNGVWGAYMAFNNAGIDLLQNTGGIAQIGFEFQGSKFTLYPESVNSGVVIRYHGGINDEQLRSNFENEIQRQFQLEIVFRKK